MVNFAEVEESVHQLKSQFTAGEIDEKTFEDRLLDLVEMGKDGYYWMFGHESEQWYRFDGEKWIPAGPKDEVLQPSAAATTPTKAAISQETDWRTLDVGWFMASLVVLAVIGGIVYVSV